MPPEGATAPSDNCERLGNPSDPLAHQQVAAESALGSSTDSSDHLALAVAEFQQSRSSHPDDAPLPRPARQKRRARSERGLPPDEELARLGTAYLERQRKNWPKLVEAGLLPAAGDKFAGDQVVRQMVEDFKDRHRTGKVDPNEVRPCLKFCPKLGGNYNRYSCDNSSPTSILDQMINALDKAHAEGRFIPWLYVFADYSVTGLDPARQGYSSYKSILNDEKHFIETTYIDDFTRPSRDEIEWWRLGALSKRLNKRMIGASDGFDLSSPNSEVLIALFGLLSRLFLKNLREKVRRGMRGAARRGTCLGKPSLGFSRRVHRDENGNIVYRPDGRPRHEPCHDPATREYRALVYELFVERNWSPYKITKHFNELKVDGWDGWTNTAIIGLLRSPASIGVFVWNNTHREFDWETEKWITVKNPRSELEIFYDPMLAIVSVDQWCAAQRKLAAIRSASPLTGRKWSRNQCSATTLFSGTLFCEYCGAELKLIRSTSDSKQLGCLSGHKGTHGCKLSASKSTRIIEESLLGYLRENILTESRVEAIVAKANAIIEQEARKPCVNTGPKNAEVRKLEAKRKKLVLRVENEEDEELCDGYHQRIKELQREINRLQAEIQDAEARVRQPPKPLSLDRAAALLTDVRKILNEEIPVAAEAIRTLTGPIKIRQEPIPGRKNGARWIATFSPDLMRVLHHAAKENRDSTALAYASSDEPQTVEVPIEKIPKYERLAPVFKQMRDRGASVQSIASAHGVVWTYVEMVLHFADTGERPKWPSGSSKRKSRKDGAAGNGKPMKYKVVAKKVTALREKKREPFSRIADKLDISGNTARRAYDYVRPDAVRKAAESGERPNRGKSDRLGDGKRKKIRKLLDEGKKPGEIAVKVGCGENTVRRVQKQMQAATEKGQAIQPAVPR